MKKNTIKLTETQLHTIITECVKKVLKENDLDEALFGHARYINPGQAHYEWESIAKKFYYKLVYKGDRQVIAVSTDNIYCPQKYSKVQIPFPAPRTYMSGAFNSGSNCYNPKDVEDFKEKLLYFFEDMKRKKEKEADDRQKEHERTNKAFEKWWNDTPGKDVWEKNRAVNSRKYWEKYSRNQGNTK